MKNIFSTNPLIPLQDNNNQNTAEQGIRGTAPIRKISKKAVLFCASLGLALSAGAQTITISGTVFDDGNGGIINGTPVQTVNGTQLYVYGIDNTNSIIFSAPVSASGTYSVTAPSAGNYNIRLSTTSAALGSSSLNLAFPNNYVATAEGALPAGDGAPDYSVAVFSTSNLVINYGIDQRPVGNPYVLNNGNLNYDANGRVIIPAAAFTGSDLEDGTYPVGFGGRSIDLFQPTGGVLYYNNTPITFTTAAVATRINNFDVSQLRLAITAGTGQSIDFSYSTVDNANVPESVPNSVHVGNPLGITLMDFAVKSEGNARNVQWMTANEQNNQYFILERSTDSKQFEQIATVQSKALNGTSNSELNYSFTDKTATTAPYLYYRLKQIDFGGKATFSTTIRVKAGSTQDAGNTTVSTWPNPTTGLLNLDINSGTNQDVVASIVSLSGQRVWTKTYQNTSGRFSTSVDLSNIPSGNYIVMLQGNGSTIQSQKLVVAH